MLKLLENFVALSRFAGQRFDLVQAGGGNSSVKLDDGPLVVKASGFALSDVSTSKGYARITISMLKEVLNKKSYLMAMNKKEREKFAQDAVTLACEQSDAQPSIETLLHSLLYRYVLHTHPIVVNALVARADWQERLMKLFPEALCVSYKTPGIDLALELDDAVAIYHSKTGHDPKILFLQNHGLIISDDDYQVVCQTTDYVCQKLEQLLETDLSSYRLTTTISALCQQQSAQNVIAYYSDDSTIRALVMSDPSLLKAKPFCPDTLVYCGFEVVVLNDLQHSGPIDFYHAQFKELPKVILYKTHIFFIAASLRKARDSEAVFKFHCMARNLVGNNLQPLDHDELCYLADWEAEKYRQAL